MNTFLAYKEIILLYIKTKIKIYIYKIIFFFFVTTEYSDSIPSPVKKTPLKEECEVSNGIFSV